jgi:hypothetical protein
VNPIVGHLNTLILPKLCPAVTLSHQDGHHSSVALLLKAVLIQVSDYRLLGASGSFVPRVTIENKFDCYELISYSPDTLYFVSDLTYP